MKFLIFSCLVFPISLKLALFAFAYFLIDRILSINGNYYQILLKAGLGIMMAIAMMHLDSESHSHFYPVSIYDYLLLIITVGIVKFYPLFPLWLGFLWGCQLNFSNSSKNEGDRLAAK